jgi:hypothetical protein
MTDPISPHQYKTLDYKRKYLVFLREKSTESLSINSILSHSSLSSVNIYNRSMPYADFYNQ